jgi:hypothetical protein
MNAFKIIAAVVLGFVAGSLVNMGLVLLGSHLVSPPAGVNLADPESLKAALPMLGPKYFFFPFLAHALGTFVGALVAFLIAPRGVTWPAWLIGFMFLGGGLAATFMIPAPKWFIVADLALAYLPMTWLALKAGTALKKSDGASHGG